MNRVPENAQSVTHDGPQGMDGDQLLGLMPPDPRRPRDPRDFRERYEPASHQQSAYPMQQDQWDEPMAAHPLFRGLLTELPPRSDPPSQDFLETWIQTARSILELLYRPGSPPRH
ncbi:hypothetical protein Afil01_60930 [Actinorhabdospora filicis]|uniref:Uncharacterized protein n=1 Tax=Actinorhabdospora filicis TaxID=1785913 RepID=A0A9W6SRY1_9ACTN|nr:hypothetical protein [Actinorhabdospora filicis]GLZ81286.1 hypothetical protein Afil01_60930 [Actinorhabdospora filicis]